MAQSTQKLNRQYYNILLHLAVQKEESTEDEIIKEMQPLLKKGVDPNVKILNSTPVLEIAMNGKMKKVVDLLLAFKAKAKLVNFQPFLRDEYMHIYNLCKKNDEIQRENVERESAQYIEWLISRGFNFYYSKHSNPQAAVLVAIKYDLHHILPTLFEHIRDMNRFCQGPQTLLHVLLDRPNADWQNPKYISRSVKILLDKGLSSDAQDASGRTPIHAAIDSEKSTDVIKMLVQHSEDINKKNERGEAALHRLIDKWTTAEEKNNDDYKELADLLLAKGANINEQDQNGLVPLFYPVTKRRIDIVEYLRDKGARLDIESETGNSLLHSLLKTDCQPNNPQIDVALIDILLASGCDVNAKNGAKMTAYDYAVKRGQSDIAQRLLERGAIADNRGKTEDYSID